MRERGTSDVTATLTLALSLGEGEGIERVCYARRGIFHSEG
jgi:hypothetical protein